MNPLRRGCLPPSFRAVLMLVGGLALVVYGIRGLALGTAEVRVGPRVNMTHRTATGSEATTINSFSIGIGILVSLIGLLTLRSKDHGDPPPWD